MGRKSKIEQGLSPEQIADFVVELVATPDLTLPKFQELAKKRGILMSLTGAARFRDGPYSEYLERLKRSREIALQIGAVNTDGAENAFADKGAMLISQRIFEILNELSPEEQTPKLLSQLSKVVFLMRAGDQKADELQMKNKKLEVQLAEYARKETQWKRTEEERAAKKEAAKEAVGKLKGASPESIADFKKRIDEM